MCSGCGTEFPTRNRLENHINRKGGGEEPKCPGKVSGARLIYPCKLCGKLFTRKDNLRSHLRTYTVQDVSDKYGNKSQKRSHGVSSCTDCTICGKSFGGSSLLVLHSLTHKSQKHDLENVQQSSKLHRCKRCGKVFTFLSTLKQHEHSCKTLQNEAEASKQIKTSYNCTKCASVFNSQLQLTGHSRVHSVLAKPHKCPICDGRFLNPAQLRLHLVSHESGNLFKNKNGENSFTCTKCDISFGNSHNLGRHLWYSHCERMDSNVAENNSYNLNTIRNEESQPVCEATHNDDGCNRKPDDVLCKIEIKVEPSDLIDDAHATNAEDSISDEGVKHTIKIKEEPCD